MKNKWFSMLFNARNIRPVLKMVRRRRNNRGVMWATLLGMGVSAAAIGFRKNQSKLKGIPLQNIFSKIQREGNFRTSNLAGLTEFAKEIMPEAGKVNNNNKAKEQNFSELIPTEDPLKNE